MGIKIEKMIEAAERGSKVLRKYFGQSLREKQKSLESFAINFRTIADLESEKKILEALQKSFPSFNIHTEEKGLIDKKSEYTFIVDPLDGTSNFVLGIANFSVSIALFKGNKVVAGVVLNPILNQVYFSRANQGAFLNKKRIRVGKEDNIKKATIGYDCDYGHYLEKYFRELLKKLEQKEVKRILVNMSPALDLCRLASGKIEAFINNGNEIYDFAAGKLIVKEAGGLITDLKGKKEINVKNNVFLTSNNTNLHYQLLKIL